MPASPASANTLHFLCPYFLGGVSGTFLSFPMGEGRPPSSLPPLTSFLKLPVLQLVRNQIIFFSDSLILRGRRYNTEYYLK